MDTERVFCIFINILIDISSDFIGVVFKQLLTGSTKMSFDILYLPFI